ncbi:MAG: hypothetical protein CME62_11460 [Halobacteriovoraceae bacterium]|nr:hypothetical protein [Halobacteriovoraceae bacterium]|tara:strand:- start:13390 stop:14070 length:681 start_codon:yes stop_codon:yes gene_type:complete
MEEKDNKLFVFERKEVVLIFVFIVMIAAIAFTMGVRVGKKLSLKEDGYTKEDIQNINLKSVEEEKVNTIVDEDANPSNLDPAVAKEQQDKDLEARLKAEMEKLAREETKMPDKIEIEEEPVEEIPAEDNTVTTNEPLKDIYNQNRDYKGKFTIQLSSHQSEAEAKEFADGFILQGYDVIINEVVIPGKGVWFRVSIGAFDSKDEAKEYLVKEQNIFQSKDYVIRQF